MIVETIVTENIETSGSVMRQRNRALDGLRGIAALGVACAHWGTIWVEYARNSVWIFFVLSGYLLASHAMHQKLDSTRVFIGYLLRRVMRLYPLYFCAIVIFSIFGCPNVSDPHQWPPLTYFVTRATFIYAEGYLWTVQQELMFYLALPFVILALLPISHKPLFCASCLLSLAAFLSAPFLAPFLQVQASPEYSVPLFATPFLLGMAIAYIGQVRGLLAKIYEHTSLSSCCLAISVLYLIFFPNITDAHGPEQIELVHLIVYAPAMIMTILLLDFMPASPVIDIFRSRLFAPVGIIGYSFYMWHWPLHVVLAHVLSRFAGLFWWNMAVTGMVSAMTYWTIEKPGMRCGRWLEQTLLKRTAIKAERVVGERGFEPR